MKIIQLMARIEGSGVTRYVIELNKGLKSLGHEVDIVYVRSHARAETTNYTQSIDDINVRDYCQETYDYLNSADLVIVNSIMERKADPECHAAWLNMLKYEVKTRKVIVVNDHKPAGFRSYYGTLLKDAEFWRSFDHICSFWPDARVYCEIRKTLGDKDALERFIQLLLPYTMETKPEDWLPAKDKIRRISYLGRHAPFKDPTRLIRGAEKLFDHNYEVELRGIKRTINAACTPDLVYEFNEKGEKLGPSKKTIFVDKPFWRAHGLPDNDPLLDPSFKRENKVYVFDAYKRDEGLQVIKHSAFGCDFFHLDHAGCYGDDYEYTIYEIVEMGTIAMLDKGASEAIRIYDKAIPTDETFDQANVSINLRKDLSNIDECLERMDYLLENPDEYEKVRLAQYEAFKKHCDPYEIAKLFVDECFVTRTETETRNKFNITSNIDYVPATASSSKKEVIPQVHMEPLF